MRVMIKLIKNGRNEVLDVIKGVAIITVVIEHAIQFGSGEEYLLKNSFFYIKNNFKKRVTTLIIPILSWVFIATIF